jgi:hypothetical protein
MIYLGVKWFFAKDRSSSLFKSALVARPISRKNRHSLSRFNRRQQPTQAKAH